MKKLKKSLVGILACLTVGTLALGVAGCEKGEAGNSTGNTSLPNTSVGTPSAPDEGGAVVKQPSEGLKYTLNEDTMSYSVTIGTCTDRDIVIPAEYKGFPVTTIGYMAFYGRSSLTSVIIGDSVTSIGTLAFNGCTSLKSVVIGDSVESIGDYAFGACISLTNLEFGDSLTSIGSAFNDCTSLRSVVIPDSVTSIGTAFQECTSLTSLEIPDSVTKIGAQAFEGCESLTSIEIGNSVIYFGERAFHGTGYYNDGNNWENGVLYIGKYLIDVSTSIAGECAVKEGTLCIITRAFQGCNSLTSIRIADSVRNIGSKAFYFCESLNSVVIGASVEKIEDCAFYCCNALTSITFEGTVDEWNAIEKGEYWNEQIPATVVACKDGNVNIF